MGWSGLFGFVQVWSGVFGCGVGAGRSVVLMWRGDGITTRGDGERERALAVGVVLELDYGAAVVVDHAPLVVFAEVDVGGGDGDGGDDFASGDDADVADEAGRLGGEDDFGLVGVAEDGAPGAEHGVAADQDGAVGVDAGDFSAAGPELGHGGQVAGVEGVVEGAVDGQNGLGVGLLGGDGRPRSRSERRG